MGRQLPTGRQGFWWRLLVSIPTLLAMLKDTVAGGYRGLTWKSGAVILFLFAYLVNPFDLVSDFMVGLGQIDDLVVLTACLVVIEKDLERYRRWKAGEKPDEREES